MTAQGVKIEPMNVIAVAIAARNGQIDGSGELSRRSGSRLRHGGDDQLALARR